MKKTLLMIVAISVCFNLYCQTKSMEFEVSNEDSFSNDIVSLEKLTPAKGDSLSFLELQKLNLQLRELNVQIADCRTDLAIMSRRRKSALIQGLIGTTATTTGVLLLTTRNNPHNDFAYVPIVAGSVLCISSVITWICSYTPLANDKVKVTKEGVVYKF